MVSRLPPLKPLPAFEAAARLLSFTEAAQELHVTQAAVSHQIKHLEEALGVSLFMRFNRALKLTPEGQTFIEAIRPALSQIGAAAQRIQAEQASGALNVSCLPSFAATWLVPRLLRFRKAFPDIDVRLSADYELTDFEVEDIDVAVRWGMGGYETLHEVRLMTEEVYPVCSPRLLENPSNPLKTPDDLKHHVLLHDDIRTDWRVWLTAAKVEHDNPERGPMYNQAQLVLQAAIAGEGVALGRSAIVHDALESGLLVRPFDLALSGRFAYWIVCPKAQKDRPKIAAFRDWLLEEASLD